MSVNSWAALSTKGANLRLAGECASIVEARIRTDCRRRVDALWLAPTWPGEAFTEQKLNVLRLNLYVTWF